MLLLFAVAASLRIVVGWYLGNFTNPELWEYEEVANHLLAGEGFLCQQFGIVYHAYVAPIYPLFCATVYSVASHSHAMLLLLQCLMSAAGLSSRQEPWPIGIQGCSIG